MSTDDIFTPHDEYEEELAEYLDSVEELPAKNKSELEETRAFLQKAAKNHQDLNATKSITIRVKQADLLKVRAKADDSQIPYQRLLNALIHKYAEGEIELKV